MTPDEALQRVTDALRAGHLDDDAMEAFDVYVEWRDLVGFAGSQDVLEGFQQARTAWNTEHGRGAFRDAYWNWLNDPGHHAEPGGSS